GFEDAALHWFVNKVKDSTTTAFTSWDQFKKELRTAFQPPHYQQHLRRQLKSLVQTGTVQEYASQFRNLVSQIDDMHQLDRVAYFVEGLKPATRMEVSYKSPETLDDAIETASRYDTAMFGLGRPTGSFTSRGYQPQKRNQQSRPIPMELDHTETYKKPPTSSQHQKKQVKCYNCGKMGHYTRD